MDSTLLLAHYQQTRQLTERLCSSLLIEDYVVQGMEDASPPKWHLAHSTWFFETAILKLNKKYQPFNLVFHQLFNSYYQLLGKPFARPNRGLLSRPSVEEIYLYRQYVDEHIKEWLAQGALNEASKQLLLLGIHHEQQHQELLLMDIRYNFSLNPLFPAYRAEKPINSCSAPPPLEFIDIKEGIRYIGAEEGGFCFDNELPRHQKIISPCAIANRLVTNQEYLHFIEDSGYTDASLWLSDGWDWCNRHQVTKPLYWYYHEDQWWEFSLFGLHPLQRNAPVAHISFYEADAYARWAKARLPTEEEWECHVRAAQYQPQHGNFLEHNQLVPLPASTENHQFFGDLWEWTSSAYAPYPRYKPFKGMVGEYNGKFMNNQRVLRGGCCITPSNHIRVSYRNFFQPEKRWQFCGIRLVTE